MVAIACIADDYPHHSMMVPISTHFVSFPAQKTSQRDLNINIPMIRIIYQIRHTHSFGVLKSHFLTVSAISTNRRYKWCSSTEKILFVLIKRLDIAGGPS